MMPRVTQEKDYLPEIKVKPDDMTRIMRGEKVRITDGKRKYIRDSKNKEILRGAVRVTGLFIILICMIWMLQHSSKLKQCKYINPDGSEVELDLFGECDLIHYINDLGGGYYGSNISINIDPCADVDIFKTINGT